MPLFLKLTYTPHQNPNKHKEECGDGTFPLKFQEMQQCNNANKLREIKTNVYVYNADHETSCEMTRERRSHDISGVITLASHHKKDREVCRCKE